MKAFALGMISQNTSDGKYRAIVDLYSSNYSLTGFARSIYKSDLLSIYGMLDFSLYTSQTISLLTSAGDSLLLYTPYITGIKLDGCTSVPLKDISTDVDEIDITNILNLQTISLVGCTGMIGELDLSLNDTIQTLNASNSSVSVKLSNSPITSLTLGSPQTIKVYNPTQLTSSGVSISSSANVTEISLVNVNTTTPCGYSVFNVIYNPS